MATDEMDLAEAETVLEVVAGISGILSGKPVEEQAAILSNLIGMFLAGWPRQQRAEALGELVDGAKQIAAIHERILFGAAGHPSNDGRG
jgi:hypothetical protein